ncbi:MAG TPA: GatB/YqeY domain-containing protein [Candidatus Kapabacteria bacterium]|nr:GatB/YqeY domain-containing protein [Candidatus Kapabacteria bacterium]
MSEIQARINEAVKDAMRAKDKDRLGTLRLATSEFKKIEVDERVTLDDARVIAILDKMIKQRKDSVTQFNAGGRADLAAKEQAEISVLQEFLPAALSDAELEALMKKAIAESGAEGMKDMGKVMAILKPQVQGRTDMGAVSQKIKALLG